MGVAGSALLAGVTPAWSADDPRLENLALCRESWLDWKTTDPAKLNSVGAYFHAALACKDNEVFRLAEGRTPDPRGPP